MGMYLLRLNKLGWKKKVTSYWVSGHMCEGADSLAKNGTSAIIYTFDWTRTVLLSWELRTIQEILNKEKGGPNGWPNAEYRWSKRQAKELLVKYGENVQHTLQPLSTSKTTTMNTRRLIVFGSTIVDSLKK